MPQEFSFNKTIDDLWESARTDAKYLGHPSALEGKRWNEIERNKCMLVEDNESESPAVFWLVGQINNEGFWLYADGGWNKKLNNGKPFYTHHATALLTQPNASGRLSQLFDKAMSGARAVEDIEKRANVKTKNSLLRWPPKINGAQCLNLKHRIFVPRDPEPDDVESQTNDETQETLRDYKEEDSDNRASGSNTQQEARDVWQEIERQWPLKFLPCHTYDSREGLKDLLNNNGHGFKWQLMEAYDIKDDPIHPDEYPKLRGATVLCSISISRWEIEEEIEGEIERGYTFSPHIVQLRVLLPPRPFGTKPETPRKRLGIDSDSPLKKRLRRE